MNEEINKYCANVCSVYVPAHAQATDYDKRVQVLMRQLGIDDYEYIAQENAMSLCDYVNTQHSVVTEFLMPHVLHDIRKNDGHVVVKPKYTLTADYDLRACSYSDESNLHYDTVRLYDTTVLVMIFLDPHELYRQLRKHGDQSD